MLNQFKILFVRLKKFKKKNMPHIASQCSTFKQARSMHGFDLKALEIETACINLLRKNLKDINKQLNCSSIESKEKYNRIENGR